jgi:hypothetical protein
VGSRPAPSRAPAARRCACWSPASASATPPPPRSPSRASPPSTSSNACPRSSTGTAAASCRSAPRCPPTRAAACWSATLRTSTGAGYDAILVDVDDSPVHLLDASHEAFYTVAGLTSVRANLRPGGVFALWTSLPAEPEVTERLRAAFADAAVEEVRFDNPLLDDPEVNALYFGTA